MNRPSPALSLIVACAACATSPATYAAAQDVLDSTPKNHPKRGRGPGREVKIPPSVLDHFGLTVRDGCEVKCPHVVKKDRLVKGLRGKCLFTEDGIIVMATQSNSYHTIGPIPYKTFHKSQWSLVS